MVPAAGTCPMSPAEPPWTPGTGPMYADGMSEHDDVLRELAELHLQLDALPPDAFEKRASIQARQEQLRARAAELRAMAAPDRTADEIRLELDRLRRIHDDLIADTHLMPVPPSGVVGPGDSRDIMAINRRIDANADRAALEHRIRELEEQLEVTPG